MNNTDLVIENPYKDAKPSGQKMSRTQKRLLERRAKKLDEKKLKQLRKTKEYAQAKLAIAEFYKKKETNQ